MGDHPPTLSSAKLIFPNRKTQNKNNSQWLHASLRPIPCGWLGPDQPNGTGSQAPQKRPHERMRNISGYKVNRFWVARERQKALRLCGVGLLVVPASFKRMNSKATEMSKSWVTVLPSLENDALHPHLGIGTLCATPARAH